MTSRRALRYLTLVIVVYAAFVGYFAATDRDPPRIVDLAALFGMTALTYAWYHFDAAERGYRRSAALGASMVVCALLAVPYYLLRSRESGTRAKAVARFVGYVLHAVVLGSAAAALGASVA